jgi:hypothetical protein
MSGEAPEPAIRPRGREVLTFPSSRRAVTAAVRAGRHIVPMHGLLEVDVTPVIAPSGPRTGPGRRENSGSAH